MHKKEPAYSAERQPLKQLPGKLYRKPQLLVRLSPAEAAHKKLEIIRHRIENIRNHPIKAPLKIHPAPCGRPSPNQNPGWFPIGFERCRPAGTLPFGRRMGSPTKEPVQYVVEGIPLL